MRRLFCRVSVAAPALAAQPLAGSPSCVVASRYHSSNTTSCCDGEDIRGVMRTRPMNDTPSGYYQLASKRYIEQMKQRKTVHSSTHNIRCAIRDCKHVSPTVKDAQIHLCRQHGKFECQTCHQKFFLQDELDSHNHFVHNIPCPKKHEKYHCEFCTLVFPHETSLLTHLLLEHCKTNRPITTHGIYKTLLQDGLISPRIEVKARTSSPSSSDASQASAESTTAGAPAPGDVNSAPIAPPAATSGPPSLSFADEAHFLNKSQAVVYL